MNKCHDPLKKPDFSNYLRIEMGACQTSGLLLKSVEFLKMWPGKLI